MNTCHSSCIMRKLQYSCSAFEIMDLFIIEAISPERVDEMERKEKDYSQYFVAPDLKAAKRRGKSGVEVIQFDQIPENMRGVGAGKKYLIQTYGCQMNVHDSETIAGILEQMGYERE